MPYSDSALDDVSETLIQAAPVGRYLDIGPGAGKYGNMVRRIHPDAHLTAIEIDPAYIEEFRLKEIYDKVICGPASILFDNYLDESYDLVIIGDCLEHMRKSEGTDLINFLVYRAKYILIIYPPNWIQGSWNGHRAEAHISVWSSADFAWLDHVSISRGPLVAVAANGLLRDEHVERGVRHILSAFELRHVSP